MLLLLLLLLSFTGDDIRCAPRVIFTDLTVSMGASPGLLHGGGGDRDIGLGSSCDHVAPQKMLTYISRGNHLSISLPTINNDTYLLFYFQGIAYPFYFQGIAYHFYF